MWLPFDQELLPTPEAPIQSKEEAYILPAPETHPHVETETGGAPTGVQSGPIAHEDIMNAVGHYADAGALHLDDPTYPSTENVDQRKKNGATRVREGYGGEQKNADLQAPIDLSSADDRLKFLNGFTQGGADDPNSANMCGPTSLIGGAVLANGANGVGTLLDAVDKLAPPDKADVQMKTLRAKLDPQNPVPLTGADMQNAQKYIYDRLNAHEGLNVNDADAMKAATESQRGIDPRTMQNLFQQSPELSALYKQNHMEIAGIDLGGANGMAEDHAVLRMTDDEGKPLMIFDPAQRTNGQVTGRINGWSGDDSKTLDNGLADYEYARRGGTGPD